MSLINRICAQLRFQHHLPERAVRRAITGAVFNSNPDVGQISARDRDTIPPKSWRRNHLPTTITTGLTTKPGPCPKRKPGTPLGRSKPRLVG